MLMVSGSLASKAVWSPKSNKLIEENRMICPSREFPKHPQVWVSCLGEGASADIRDAEGLGKAQCSGASNPRASSSFLSPHRLRCNESPVQPRRPLPQLFQVAVRSAGAAAADAAGAPRQRWSCLDCTERAALRVFNLHTLDSSQNDH